MGNQFLWPMDPDFAKTPLHEKYLIIQCEDRTCTEARTADTLDDPRRKNNSFWCFKRMFSAVEALAIHDGEPRSIPWNDFAEVNDEGDAINKQWLDTTLLR